MIETFYFLKPFNQCQPYIFVFSTVSSLSILLKWVYCYELIIFNEHLQCMVRVPIAISLMSICIRNQASYVVKFGNATENKKIFKRPKLKRLFLRKEEKYNPLKAKKAETDSLRWERITLTPCTNFT